MNIHVKIFLMHLHPRFLTLLGHLKMCILEQNIKSVSIFSHRKEKQSQLLRALKEGCQEGEILKPRNKVLNGKLLFSCSHLQMLIASSSVFMVLSKKINLVLISCIFYIFYNAFYLKCVALDFMHSSIFVYCILCISCLHLNPLCPCSLKLVLRF